MGYLKQKHSQCLWVNFILISALLIIFSNIDITVSRFYFSEESDEFYLKHTWWVKLLYKSCAPVILFSLLSLLILWQINKCKGTNYLSIDGKKVMFVFVVLVLGAGIIVNALFKDQFGRARPRDVIEFNGSKQFTPAFMVTDQCDRNCSFSSGHGAGAYFTLALAMLFRNKKRALALAFTFGTSVSLARIVAGGHFFSDNVVSFFVMAIMTDALYYIFYLRDQEPPLNDMINS